MERYPYSESLAAQALALVLNWKVRKAKSEAQSGGTPARPRPGGGRYGHLTPEYLGF